MSKKFGGIHPSSKHETVKLVVGTGLVFVLLSSLLIYGFLSNQEQHSTAETITVVQDQETARMVEVLVPVQEIPAGTALEPRMFRKESLPQVGLSTREVGSFEELRGHYARSIIVSGQPLHRELISAVRPSSAIESEIPDGFRAVTIRVDDRTSVEGFVQPRARVDVVWVSTVRNRPSITTIVENARILSAERQTDVKSQGANTNPPRTVTLLVTVDDAQKIQLASTAGQLSLSLRGEGDSGKGTASRTITIDDLLSGRPLDKAPQDRIEGTLTVGGERFTVVKGKLVPVAGQRQ